MLGIQSQLKTEEEVKGEESYSAPCEEDKSSEEATMPVTEDTSFAN